MIVVFAALLSGAMFYLSQGLDNVWALAWLAPVPVLWLAYGETPLWQVILVSVVATLASMIYVAQCYMMMPWMILLAVLVLQAACFTTAVLFGRYVHRRAPPVTTLCAFPVCWTTFEYLTEYASPHGTFGSFAYSQVSAPLLIQSASLFGLYSVTFLICLFANTIAMALRNRRESAVAIAVGLSICGLNIAFGLMRLAAPQPETVRVAAMVDETTVVTAFHEGTLEADVRVSDAYANAIRSVAAEGAKFVVTPEGGIFSRAAWRSAVLAPLAAASKETGTHVIAGVLQVEPWGDLAFSLEPDGTERSYAKRHPVPGLEDRFTPGRASGWLGNGRAMQICKDMDFPRTVRPDAENGVRLMGAPAGDFVLDAWLHGRMAIMRGVENGFALVRAANDGMLTASDAQGRLIASKTAAPTGMTMIVADLPLGPGPTLYTRIGDAFAWLCVSASLVLGAYVFQRRTPLGREMLPL